MKKNVISLMSLVLLAGLVSLTSCKKDNTGDGSQFYATMEQCADHYGKTVLNGSMLNWTSADQVRIYGTAGSGLYTAQPQSPATNAVFNNVSGRSGEAPYYAIYPASIATAANSVTLPATQVTEDGSLTDYPMYAESTDNHLAFKNLCGLLKLHLTKANTSISSITITASSEINGNYSVNYNGGNPTLIYVSDGSNTTTLTCTTAQASDNGRDFYVYLPAGSYSNLSIIIADNQGMACTKSTNTGVMVNVYRSQYTAISLGENDLVFRPIGSKGGLFTINEDGDQVWFSQGNLQYQASTDTWRFADNQWDYVGGEVDDDAYVGTVSGSNNNLISTTYSGWIDLFGWGTGDNPTLHTRNNDDYSTFVDWGSNAISNGGNIANLWRTPTLIEMSYVFNNRTNSTNLGTANARYAKGKVNNIYGVILFPDNYTHPTGVAVPTGINSTFSEGWGSNNYSLTQWSEMEEAGAVFLPAAGQRMRAHINYGAYQNANVAKGHYWTNASWMGYGGCLFFESINFSLSYNSSCYLGHSVRLIQDNN